MIAHESNKAVIEAEGELLDNIRLTETCEELDTLTIAQEFINQPERFMQICQSISRGATFMRMNIKFDSES